MSTAQTRAHRDTASNSFLSAALDYAKRGLAVIVLHSPENGGCSCKEKAKCGTPGKHPRWHQADLPHGANSATTDEKIIRQWWQRWPKANVGIATGEISGLIVLDIDPRNGGDKSLKRLPGNLPITPTSRTGGKGEHYLLKHPGNGCEIANDIGFAGYAGIDLKSDGGLIVAPPSRHISGEDYYWKINLDTPLAPTPNWLLELIKKESAPERKATPVGEVIPTGARVKTLISLAGTMRKRGMNEPAILAALEAVNLNQCEGPLPAAKIQDIAQSYGKYAPGELATQGPPCTSQATTTDREPHTIGSGLRLTDVELLNFAKAGQVGDARLFIRLFAGNFVYDHAAGRWYRWGGHYWLDDDVENVLVALDRVVDLYHQAAANCAWQRAQATRDSDEKAAKDAAARESIFLKKIASLQNKRWRRDVLEFAAAGDGSLGIGGKEWDQNTMLIACPNGVIDLSTGDFRPGKPDDYIKVACPTEWKGINEPCPEWDKFQLQIFNGDVELVGYVRRLCGYAISGQRIERVLPIPWGIGWNGKGTTFETLEHTLGDLAGPVPAELLLEDGKNYRSGGAPTPEIMRLRGKRLVWASETNEGRKLNPGKVKWLTGGDTLVGRDPFGKRLVSFPPTHTLFLMTNHKPKANADDFALWQRINLIPFELSFVDHPTEPHERQRDKHIVSRLKKEGSGILAWLVRGFFEYKKHGLNPPAKVTDATTEYRKTEDTIGQFIAEQCVVHESASVKAGEFYGKYQKWCEENGHKPVWGNIFGQSMAVKFPKKDTKTGVYYFGVGIRSFDTNG